MNSVPKNLSKNAQQLLYPGYIAREKLNNLKLVKEAEDKLKAKMKKAGSSSRPRRGDNATSDAQSVATTAAAIDESAYEKLPELDANIDMAK